MSTGELVRRIARSRRPGDGQGRRVVDLGWGWAVLRSGAPHLEADSRVVVAEPWVSWADVVAAADSTLGPAGLRHRRVEWWSPSGAAAPAGVPPAGAVAGEELVMVLGDGRPSEDDRRRAGAAATAAGVTLAARVVEDGRLVQHHVSADGQVVALCHLDRTGSVGEVEGVSTEPDWRRRGLARMVVTAACTRARAEGVRTVWLRVGSDNPAIGLYSGLGFAPVGTVSTWSWTAT